MLLFYVDEHGDNSLRTDGQHPSPGLRPGTSPFFTLAAVGIRDSSRRPLAERLIELKDRHFGTVAMSGSWVDTEIKGRHIVRAARKLETGSPVPRPAGFASFTSAVQIADFIHDLGLVFSTFKPIIFAASVDKRAMLAQGKHLEPIGVAYTYLHQRIALLMENVYGSEAAMIVADQQTQHERLFRAGVMRDIRVELTRRLPRQPNYDLVLDKPLWVDTDLSIWDREIIQLADIVAYAVAEALVRGTAPENPSYFWQQISESMARQFRTGEIAGGGLSVYPRGAHIPDV